MAKTKRKQLAAIATKRKEASSNRAASPGLTLDDIDDSWVEVRKQRVVIVIPPLPKAKPKLPSAIAGSAKLIRPGLKKSSSGRIISSRSARGGKGRKLLPKANVSSARQSCIDGGEAMPPSESKGKRKWSSVLSTKGTKRRRPTSSLRDDALAAPRISSMDILLASVDSLHAEEAARSKLWVAAPDNQPMNGSLAKGKQALDSEVASRVSLDGESRKIQEDKFTDTKTSPELSVHGGSHLQMHATKRRGIPADDDRLLLKHVRKRRNLHEVRADDGNTLPKHAMKERASHGMAVDTSRPVQKSTLKGENMHSTPSTRLERKTVISKRCLDNKTVNPIGKGKVVHSVSKLSEVNFKPSSLRRKEKAFPNYPHMPLITANQAFKVLTLKRQLERAGGLSRWLQSVGLGQFTEVFERRMFSELELLQLNMDDLKRMWKPAVGPRRKLICAIEHLSQRLE